MAPGLLIANLGQENLIPHSPLLVLFTACAQTHIFPEIRIDALRFLDLFLEVIPEPLVTGWTEGSSHGNQILEGYICILNAGTKFGETEGEYTIGSIHWSSLTGTSGQMQATSTASVVLSPTVCYFSLLLPGHC